MKFTSYIQMKSINQLLKDRGLEERGRVQKFIDKEVIRIMTPYTPKDTGELIRSATRLTQIGTGIIRQGGKTAPYAVKLYNKNARFNGAPMRGNKWFRRAMDNGGKKIIFQGVKGVIKK